jgi:hypothetical protein
MADRYNKEKPSISEFEWPGNKIPLTNIKQLFMKNEMYENFLIETFFKPLMSTNPTEPKRLLNQLINSMYR